MKKLNANSFLWMPALALIGVVACNKVPDNVSPDFDPETNTVKTQLILNVSTNSPSTKMPASTVLGGHLHREQQPYAGTLRAAVREQHHGLRHCP